MFAADGGFAVTIDQIAESLRQDPVLVQETIGNGDSQGTHDRLTRLVQQLRHDKGMPAYVALVLQPRDLDAGSADSAEYLVQALHTRLKQPGLYIVETNDSTLKLQTFDQPGVDDTLLDLHYFGNEHALEKQLSPAYAKVGDKLFTLAPGVDAENALLTADHPIPEVEQHEVAGQPPPYYPSTLTKAETDSLVRRQLFLEPPDERRGDDADAQEPLSTGARWVIGSAAGLSVMLLVQQTLRGWPGWRRREPIPAGGPRVTAAAGGPPRMSRDKLLRRARAQARGELDRLTAELAATDPRTEPALDATLRDAASTAHDLAEHYVDSDRLEEVVGALTLATAGRADLARATDPSAAVARRCFFNPLHGRATTTTSSAFGDAQVGIPSCQACAARVARGRAPDALEIRDGLGSRPYYETRSVWARTGFGSLVDDYAAQVLASRHTR